MQVLLSDLNAGIYSDTHTRTRTRRRTHTCLVGRHIQSPPAFRPLVREVLVDFYTAAFQNQVVAADYLFVRQLARGRESFRHTRRKYRADEGNRPHLANRSSAHLLAIDACVWECVCVCSSACVVVVVVVWCVHALREILCERGMMRERERERHE